MRCAKKIKKAACTRNSKSHVHCAINFGDIIIAEHNVLNEKGRILKQSKGMRVWYMWHKGSKHKLSILKKTERLFFDNSGTNVHLHLIDLRRVELQTVVRRVKEVTSQSGIDEQQ